jgi:hypothetical protein
MSSISAMKAKATHDAAMSIIAKEAKERAAKTEHLRRLRLTAEAGAVDRVAVPRMKTPVTTSRAQAGKARAKRAA